MMQRYENKGHSAITSLPVSCPLPQNTAIENSLMLKMHDNERRFKARRRTHRVLRCLFGKRYRHGVTRFVVLAGVSAYKVPRFDSGLSLFLTGWLANRSEKQKWHAATHQYQPTADGQPLPHMRLAPVRRTYLWGLLLVMARCREITKEHGETWIEAELERGRNDPDTAFDWSYWCCDLHPANLGWYQDRIVCLDYSG